MMQRCRPRPPAPSWRRGPGRSRRCSIGVIPFGLVAGRHPGRDRAGRRRVDRPVDDRVRRRVASWRPPTRWPTGRRPLVAVIAACTINLRLMLYSASLAPHLAAVPLRTPPDDRLPAHRPGLRGVDRPVDEGGRRRGRRRAARARARPQGALLLRRRADAVGQLAGVHDRRRPRRLGAARLAAARLRGAARVPRAARAGHHLAARRRWPRSSVAAWRCSPPRPGASHLSVLFGALAGIVAGAVAEAFIERRAARRRHAARRPTRGWRRERRVGRHRPGRHRHLRDARVVPRVRPPARRRAARACSGSCARSRRPPSPPS